VDPDPVDRHHWATPTADSTIDRVNTVRERYRRWQRRRESLLGRASRRLRRIAERRLARPAPARDRLSSWWTWAIVVGAIETTGQIPWFTRLAPRSAEFTRIVTDWQTRASDVLAELTTADPVTHWLTHQSDAAWAATAAYPVTLPACTVLLRRTRRLPRAIRTPVAAVAGLVGVATAAAYTWHLLATRFTPLLASAAALSLRTIAAIAVATLVLVRVVAGPARRI
jgi:hypothetical protein